MPWVYIMASKPRGTLYIGLTENLRRRSTEHRGGRGCYFTKKYGVYRLVWFEHFDSREIAKQRERTMKDWPRAWKINIIERLNPQWNDLSQSISEGSQT